MKHIVPHGLARHALFVAYLNQLIWKPPRTSRNIVIIGDTGTGKSTIAAGIAKGVDRQYELKRNTFYDVDAFFNFFETEPPPGSAPIFDDLAAATDVRKWWDDFNRAISRTSQFGGSFRYVSIYLAPNLSGIIADIRSLANFILMTESEVEYAGWYNVRRGIMSQNLSHPSIYFPYLSRKVIDANGNSMNVKFKGCYAPKMPDDEYRRYEEYKESFTRPAVKLMHKEAKARRMRTKGVKHVDSERDIVYY